MPVFASLRRAEPSPTWPTRVHADYSNGRPDNGSARPSVTCSWRRAWPSGPVGGRLPRVEPRNLPAAINQRLTAALSGAGRPAESAREQVHVGLEFSSAFRRARTHPAGERTGQRYVLAQSSDLIWRPSINKHPPSWPLIIRLCILSLPGCIGRSSGPSSTAAVKLPVCRLSDLEGRAEAVACSAGWSAGGDRAQPVATRLLEHPQIKVRPAEAWPQLDRWPAYLAHSPLAVSPLLVHI